LQDHSTAPISGGQAAPLVDRLLRFDPALEQRYEAETGRERVANLRETFWLGLVLFNAHNITNTVLVPDVLWFAVALRLLVVTPVVVAALIVMGRMPPAFREAAILLMVGSAFAMEIVLFLTTRSEFGAYAFNEFTLTLIYGNMLLPLRFRFAMVFTGAAFALATLAVCFKPGLDDALRFAFAVQIAMACIISLYANFKVERRRCRDYVVAHLAVQRAEQADSAKQRFQDQSRTDPVTGLPNRRALDEHLRDRLADGQPLAVMMIDLDHFKLFNDTLGHQAGDACLKSVGVVLATAAKHPDVLCARFGGEEFTAVFRSADREAILRLANAFVRTIEFLQIAHPGRSDGIAVVTASVGVALKPEGRTDPEAVLAAADRALYRAKRRGRNGYVLGDEDRPARVAAA